MCCGCHACHRWSFTLGPQGLWWPVGRGPGTQTLSSPGPLASHVGQHLSGHDAWLPALVQRPGRDEMRNQAEVQTRGGKDSCRLGKGKGHQLVCLSVPKKRTWQEGLDNAGDGCKKLPKMLGWVGENQGWARPAPRACRARIEQAVGIITCNGVRGLTGALRSQAAP